MRIVPIGIVRNQINESVHPSAFENIISNIEIYDVYTEGLDGLKQGDLIDVIFNFSLSEKPKLKLTNARGELKGVFATRSPNRPSAIGVTSCKIIYLSENTIQVKGLDAINGTKVLDIKPTKKR